MEELIVNTTDRKPKGGRSKSKLKCSLSDFLSAWDRHKADKEANPFEATREVRSGSQAGTTKRYAQRPYSVNGFAREMGYTRFSHLKEAALKRGKDWADAIEMIEGEFDDRLDLLAMTGAINPIYTARIRRLCDKQIVEHEGEVTTRSAEKPCTAEEAAAHFADWNRKI